MTYTYKSASNTVTNGATVTIANTGAVSGSGGYTIGSGLTTGITLNGTGGTGQIYTTTGTGASWVSPTDHILKINQTNPPTIEVKGNMVINGRALEERLNTIEKVLCFPDRDVKLEKKHPKLKKL